MDPDRPAFLGESDDMLLDLFAGGHHHVGDFVSHDHDEREVERNACTLFVRFRLQAIHQLFFAQLVVTCDVPHASFCEKRVSLFHFFNSPGEDCLGLAHIGDHRVHQVRESSIPTELHHFGVNHQHADFVGTSSHQHGRDDGVQANALTCTCATRDQKVGHRGEVHD